jgi:hypothetical protein
VGNIPRNTDRLVSIMAHRLWLQITGWHLHLVPLLPNRPGSAHTHFPDCSAMPVY